MLIRSLSEPQLKLIREYAKKGKATLDTEALLLYREGKLDEAARACEPLNGSHIRFLQAMIAFRQDRLEDAQRYFKTGDQAFDKAVQQAEAGGKLPFGDWSYHVLNIALHREAAALLKKAPADETSVDM